MKLYHFSEVENIKMFIPKESKALWGHKKYVWALSEEKMHNYLLPRECPRICISNKEASKLNKWISKAERQKFEAHIFVCEDWKKEIETCKLFKYQFDSSQFKLIDEIAGYFVSEEIAIPKSKYLIENCMKELKLLKVNLKFISKIQMKTLSEDVIVKLKDFSIIKWTNI